MPVRKAFYLTTFAISAVIVWMLPAWLAGFPNEMPEVAQIKAFAENGVFPMDSMRLTPVLLSLFHPLIAWENLNGWVLVNAIAFALTLIAWWFFTRRFFDERTAWISSVIFALMPVYWLKALHVDGYVFALLFLFLACNAFLVLGRKRRILRSIVCGLIFGLTIASRDAFILFFPWLLFSYFWIERRKWARALVECALFAGFAVTVYSFPFIARSMESGLNINERIGILMEAAAPREASWSHFYPDQYTYEFEREEYGKRATKEFESQSWLERQQHRHYRLIFGVDAPKPVISFLDGLWLFVNRIPSLFMQDTVGGIFLWLFILPGMAVFFREKRKLLVLLIGLALSVELIVRFGFHFQRLHLMNYGWMLALFAAAGIIWVCETLGKQSRRITPNALAAFIAAVIALQMVQANRKQFAQLYARSSVPSALAAASQLNALPENSVTAFPIEFQTYFALSNAKRIYFHEQTVKHLLDEGKLKVAFENYGVTHAIGYSDELLSGIKKAMPDITIIEPVSAGGVKVTPVVRYLLHLIR